MFGASFREAGARLRTDLRAVARGRIPLSNTNFDTGRVSRHGEYPLADDTHAELMERLFASHFVLTGPALRRHLRAYYGPRPPPSPRSDHERKHWKEVNRALDAMS